MLDVEIRDVDGVIVVSHNRVVLRISDFLGVHHNNLQHTRGFDHGLRYIDGHCGTTLSFKGGGRYSS